MNFSNVGARESSFQQPRVDGARAVAAVRGNRPLSIDDINKLDDALLNWVRNQPPALQADARATKAEVLKAVEADPARKAVSLAFGGPPATLIELLGHHEFGIRATVVESGAHLLPPPYAVAIGLADAEADQPVLDAIPPDGAAPQAVAVRVVPQFVGMPGDPERLLNLANVALKLDAPEVLGVAIELFTSSVLLLAIPDREKRDQLAQMTRLLANEGHCSSCPLDMAATMAKGLQAYVIPAMNAVSSQRPDGVDVLASLRKLVGLLREREPGWVRDRAWGLQSGEIQEATQTLLEAFEHTVRFPSASGGVTLVEATLAALIRKTQLLAEPDFALTTLCRVSSHLGFFHPNLPEPARAIATRILKDLVLPAMRGLEVSQPYASQRNMSIRDASALIQRYAFRSDAQRPPADIYPLKPDAAWIKDMTSQLTARIRETFQHWAQGYRNGSDRDYAGRERYRFTLDTERLVREIAALPSTADQLRTFGIVLATLAPERRDQARLYKSVKGALDAYVVPAVSDLRTANDAEAEQRVMLLRQLKTMIATD